MAKAVNTTGSIKNDEQWIVHAFWENVTFAFFRVTLGPASHYGACENSSSRKNLAAFRRRRRSLALLHFFSLVWFTGTQYLRSVDRFLDYRCCRRVAGRVADRLDAKLH